MFGDSYIMGSDVIGADAGAGPYVTIHLNDIPKLIADQGGASGVLAYKYAPRSVEIKAYASMVDELAQALKEKGVDADVRVSATRPPGGALTSEFALGAGVAVGGMAVSYGIYQLIKLLLK